ncbi:ABC transporter substrate-binding protein [Paenibacillus periandrae]|uniref:ABC transporter substrate-binding protein n=1 Tax=Paenibacillus periandrae TaxID=1761741 RepID=UPI001F08C243|nr:ABC transporter substrate-binding protein [Paenibacillus periandrae]
MTTHKTSKLVLLLILVMSMITLAACSGSNGSNVSGKPEAASDKGGTVQTGNKAISIGITNAPGSFSTIDVLDQTAIHITSLLFPPLVELNDSMEFVPMLADRIETKDNKTFTVKLNEKAKWSDGKPVTADDLLFTVQMITHPKSISNIAKYYAVIEGFDDKGKQAEGANELTGVKKIDDHTVQFIAKAPLDPVLFKENIGRKLKPLPKHILKDADPEKIAQHPFWQKMDVTYGPFNFVSYQKDQYVELQANKDYFKGAPKLNKLFFKIMPAANIVAQLQSGEIQMNFPGVGTISIQDFEKVKNMSNLRTIQGKPLNYQQMTFNSKTLPDARVRQAIAYAINRDMMVNDLLKGEGEVIDMPYTSIHPYYNKSLKPYKYDPKKAQQLLQEAGWDFNKTLNLVVPSGVKTREQSADIIVENLKAIGVKAQVTKYDLVTVGQKASKGEFDIFFLGYPFSLDPDVSNYFLSSVTGGNYGGYNNPKMDELLKEGIKETDPAKRIAIYNKVQELIAQDMPQLTLYADYRLGAVSKKVKVGEPKDVGMLINVNEWDIEN